MFFKNNQAPRAVNFVEDLAEVCVGNAGNVTDKSSTADICPAEGTCRRMSRFLLPAIFWGGAFLTDL